MRVAVTGAGGQLGADLTLALAAAGHEILAWTRADLDVTDAARCAALVEAARPDAVIHAAAWTDVDGCERDPARARSVIVDGTANIVAAASGVFCVVVSTDYVFDGSSGRAYTEADDPAPLQEYGRAKLAAERAALAASHEVAIARTAWLYGARRADGEPVRNFVASILGAQGTLTVVDDQVGSPTATCDLAPALVALVEARAPGVFHAVNDGEASRAAFAAAIVAGAGGDPGRVTGVPTAEAPPRPARRPLYAPLDGTAWRAAGFGALPSWESGLRRTLAAMGVAP